MVNVDWGDEFIPAMLDVFAHYGVLATWFPTGRWVQVSPDLAKQISQAGHNRQPWRLARFSEPDEP